MNMSRILSLFAAFGLLLAMVACGGNSTPPPPPPVLLVSPSSASVKLATSQTFTVTNATGAVNWSINPPVGSISPSGVYIAPSTFPATSSVTVTASLGGQTGTATAQVVYPNDNSTAQSGAVKMGTSGGDVLDETTTPPPGACCIGTLGSLIKDTSGNFFILSNNHVLGKSDAGTIGAGDLIDHPGPSECFIPSVNVGTTVARAALKPVSNSTTGNCANSGAPLCGPAPSNVDAAIAAITPGAVDTSGSILDLGTAGATSIGNAPPSATLADPAAVLAANERVAKSGRTTGLTCSTLQATNTVIVPYFAKCGDTTPAFAAFFTNQVIVNGGTFSAAGDSGSLIITADTARPVALLYAGNNTSTAGNPISEVLTKFPTTAPGAVIVGGADHAVSCAPTSSAQSTQVGAQSAPVSAGQRQAAINARNRNADALMSADPAIRSVETGASSDGPGEAALVIELTGTPKVPIPPVVDGVRTKVVYAQGVAAPTMTVQDVHQTAAIKQLHEADVIAGKGIQGIGVGQSDDNPAETAIVIYTIQGEPHPPIPAAIDGVRTKIVEGDRFRAFGWNSQLEPKGTACAKPRVKIASSVATPKNKNKK
jgi:hypothetical protein